MKRILAIGGGGFLMEDSPSPIDAFILRLTGKQRPRICLVATPSGDMPEHIDKFYAAFDNKQCEPSHLAFFRKPAPGSVKLSEFVTHLLNQDAIFVSGGNTKSALGVWREWGLDKVFLRAHEAGVLLTGMSAGAMCWFEAGLTDSFWGAGYQPLQCLGILTGGCGVHYHSDGERRTRLFTAIEAGAIPSSVAIDDFAALLFEDGRAVRAFNWRAGAGVFQISLRNGKTLETAYSCESIG